MKMNFIFFVSLLAFSLQCSHILGMAVVASLQDRIAKQSVRFSEDTDPICESHRNYRQASIEPTASPIKNDASGAKEELKIVIKHHKTGEEKEGVDNLFNKRTASDENEQLEKDLEKKMGLQESKDKNPKTRSYPESVLHHRGSRYDRPSNGNLEVFLGGSSSGSHEYEGFAEPEWQYQGFENQGPSQDYNHHHRKLHRYRRPYPESRYEGDRYKSRDGYPEPRYENQESGYRTSSDEYVPKRRKGYRNEEEQGYKARKKTGYRGYENPPSGYEAQYDPGHTYSGSQNEESGYHSESEENYYEKENKYSPERNSDDDVLVKISVNNNQDSADLGKLMVDIKKDKELFPDERQLKISVKKDKDLPPGEERDIKLEVKSDCQKEEHEEYSKIYADKDSCESEDERTIIEVKKPKKKCCKKRKNKCSRRRKY